MAFTFRRQEQIPSEIRRLSTEQVEKALTAIKNTKLPPNDAIHECRKRCKHIRALLRLVRSCSAELAREENEHVREMAADLSHLRDAFVMLETFESLFQKEGNKAIETPSPEIHKFLKHAANTAQQKKQLSQKRKVFRERAENLLQRIAGWSIDSADFNCLKESMKESYKQGGRAMRKAFKERTPEGFHEWRKRVKEFGYHLDLLKEAWPSLLKSFHNQVDKLGELLGRLNDLNVLQRHLVETAGLPEEELKALLEIIAAQKGQKELDAELLGTRVYAERPKALTRRLSVYWKVWQTCLQITGD